MVRPSGTVGEILKCDNSNATEQHFSVVPAVHWGVLGDVPFEKILKSDNSNAESYWKVISSAVAGVFNSYRYCAMFNQ